MKRILLGLLIFLTVFISVSYSSLIDVQITEILMGNLTAITYDNSSNSVKLVSEVYNTGSIGYKNRVRMEVFNDSKLIFTGWSKEKVLMPGDKKTFETYWYEQNGVYSIKMRMYFGNEIKEVKTFDLKLDNYKQPEDVFEITGFRTYDNFIVFDVKSKMDVENVVIMPSQYRYGWVFEQESIESMSANVSKAVKINYHPTVWSPSGMSIRIVSDEGVYYSEEAFEMNRETGLMGALYYLLDSLKLALS